MKLSFGFLLDVAKSYSTGEKCGEEGSFNSREGKPLLILTTITSVERERERMSERGKRE